jgi:hypothetical protein
LSELQGDNAGPGSHFGPIASHLLTAARSQTGRFFSLQAHRFLGAHGTTSAANCAFSRLMFSNVRSVSQLIWQHKVWKQSRFASKFLFDHRESRLGELHVETH